MLRYSGHDTTKATDSRELWAVEPPAPWEQRPRWAWLYTVLLLVATLGLTAAVMAATPGWRRLVEVLTGG